MEKGLLPHVMLSEGGGLSRGTGSLWGCPWRGLQDLSLLPVTVSFKATVNRFAWCVLLPWLLWEVTLSGAESTKKVIPQRPCFLSNWLPRAQWMRSSAEPRPERNIHTVSCSLTGLVEVLTMVLPTTMPDPLHFCSLPSSSTRFILQNTELNIAC